jgi:hypothetical protein
MLHSSLEVFSSDRVPVRLLTSLAVATLLPVWSYAQDASRAAPASLPAAAAAPASLPQENKRLFWLLPNHRSSPTLNPYKPISSKEKFKIAAQDSFDWGALLLAGAFAGKGQWSNTNPSFGQGAAGYARYLGTGYADVVIGNMMTVGVYPSLLCQDPRYFRRGTGSAWSRLGYAMAQIFVTHNNSGRRAPNYSEILGTATAVGISNAYYPDNRDLGSNASRFGVQIGIDMAGNIIKEFGPDVGRKRSHTKSPNTGSASRSSH